MAIGIVLFQLFVEGNSFPIIIEWASGLKYDFVQNVFVTHNSICWEKHNNKKNYYSNCRGANSLGFYYCGFLSLNDSFFFFGSIGINRRLIFAFGIC